VGAGVALKKSTGEPAWQHGGFPGLATPVLFTSRGRTGVALFGGDQLIARDARTGAALFSIPWKTDLAVNACDPVLWGDRLFLCSDYGLGRALYDISGAQPRQLWSFGRGRGSNFSSGFQQGGQLYCFAEGQFNCLDPATGLPRWQVQGGSGALLIGETLILVRHTGELRLGKLTPTGYHQVSTFDTGMRDLKAVPAYWNGRLFLRSESGRIGCIQIGTPV
jgi:outer membrane protein assembly factor BamB